MGWGRREREREHSITLTSIVKLSKERVMDKIVDKQIP